MSVPGVHPEVDLLIATASVPGFADGLALRLGVSAERLAPPADGSAGAHTAASAVALGSAGLAGQHTALFVAVGSGITAAVALYRAWAGGGWSADVPSVSRSAWRLL